MTTPSPGTAPGSKQPSTQLAAAARDTTSKVTATQLFDSKGSRRLAVTTIFVLCGVLVAAVAWSSVMPLAEISVSSGEVLPSGSVKHIQHLEGGIVSELLVREGEEVKKGQPLVVLAPDIAQSELHQLVTRNRALSIRIRLLDASLDGRKIEIESVDPRYRGIASAEYQALTAKHASLESQSKVISQQVRERTAERETLLSQTKSLDEQIELTRKRIKSRQKLVKKGLFPRMRLIDDQRDLSRLTGKRAEVDLEAIRIKERILESETRLAELQSKFKSDVASEISTLTKEAAELELTIDRARDKVNRLTVRAPVSGRVHGLQLKTIGGVVGEGTTMMEIVPTDAKPYVEARVSTGDVGHVRVGQKAKIKVMTYDYSRYGTVAGRVSHISPTAFTDDDGRPYYRAYIDLENNYVGSDDSMPVTPGMTVVADIITGEKTLLNYITSPVTRSVDSAMRER
jgi:membrane fusion protein, adhesin transport system